MALTFVGTAFIGVLLLPHTNGPPWLRLLGRALAGLLALAFSVTTVSLYQLCEERHWTGDGPGLLVVMMILPVGALCALAAGFAALWPGLPRSGRVDASPWLAVGMIAVGLAGAAQSTARYQRELRHAHDAPVVALQFVDDDAALLSCDRAGTLAHWKLPERELVDVRSVEALAGARQVMIARHGRFAVALVDAGARIVSLQADGPAPVTLPGVTQVALLADGEVALADGREVRIVSLPAPGVSRATHAFAAAVTALAADAQGRLFVALDDGAVIALGERGEPDRELTRRAGAVLRLVASPGGRWLVALDAQGRPAVIATPDGTVRVVDAWMHMHALAFVSEEQLVFTASELDPSALALSLERLETEPWFNHGQSITALGAAPGLPDAAIALGGDLHLVPAPASGRHAYADASVRLVRGGYF
jgi:hypothetical protein